ncbi:hypothetical protein BGZ70_000849 [Mortierella alpina]|uniref:Uncharacterized protein n=1 Tax=Mortierella alpina TaxID=64518 RepID=A0A9P6IXF4_MORAP|nr:hypothetical protein BGZ70_000849 [Mortierella alpina]
MANGKVFINPKTGYLSNREKQLPPPPPRGPVLTVRNPTHASSSSSSSSASSPVLNKGKGKAIAPSISASSSRSNYSHLSYLSTASLSSSEARARAKGKGKAFAAAAASSSSAGVGRSSSAGPSKGKTPVRAAMPSKAGAPAPFPSYGAGKIKASNPSPCYLTGIGRPKELRTHPGPARMGPASGADFCTPAGAPQIGLTWMLTKNKGSPTANRRPLPLMPPPRVHMARAQRSFPATTPSSDRSSRASPDPVKSSISSFWLSGSSPSASTASVGRTSSFFSVPVITVEDELGPVDDDGETPECGYYWYEDPGIEEDDDGERILTVRNHNEGELRARHWRASAFTGIRLTTSSLTTDTSHSAHSTSSTASSRPSSLRVRTMRARTLDKLEGRAPGAPLPNPVAGPIFMPAPTPSPPPGPSKFKQFVDRQKVNLRTVKNKVKWKLQGRTVVRPVARDGPSNFEID